MKRLSKRVLATVLMLVLVLALPFAAQAGGCSNNGEHQWSQWFTEFSATCEWPGEQYRYCEICKTNERREYPAALGHNFQFVVREQPTCTKAGYGIDTCTRCGVNKDNGRPIPALGHNYERSIAQQPTCTSDGMAIYRCTRCGDSYREPIPATGHKWGAWQQGEAATCVKYGNRYHDCSRCGAREWERDYASGLGDHDWGEWVTVKEPTATEDGLKERTCKVDARHKEQEVIPATGELAEEAKPALELYMDLWV
ncbi:MAG: hypothetical protein J5889_09030, partial [Clostridia bacterium]|nr:hypothetical protein [Clostridia bacterium]